MGSKKPKIVDFIALFFFLIIVYFIEFVVNINAMVIIENLHKKNGQPS